MKCDELKPIDLECNMGKDVNGVEHREPWKAYDIDEVDAAIAELKDEINRQEGVGKRWFARCMEARTENVRLKRALWIAHAYKAKFKRWWLHLALDCEASMIRPDTKTINRIKGKIGNCEKSERKCRAKAEELK